MRRQASADATDGSQSPPPRRALKTALLIVATTLLAVTALVFAWGARRYQQGVELAQRTREQYRTLDAEFPFTPPAAGQAIPDARWQALLRVRRRIQDQAPPALRQTLHALLGASSFKDPALYSRLMAGIPLLARTLGEQVSGLRTEQMSAREYQWLLGLAINGALRGRSRFPAGQGYWGVLEQVARLSREGGAGPAGAAETAAFYEKQYPGAPSPGAPVLDALQNPDEAAYALDLLLASAQWAGIEGPSPDGIMRRLLPQR